VASGTSWITAPTGSTFFKLTLALSANQMFCPS